jgi:hypothetical protein
MSLPDNPPQTPLEQFLDAAWTGKIDELARLYPQIEDIDAGETEGRPALYMAAYNSHPDAVRWLLEKGARVNVREVTGDHILHAIARIGSPECLALLLAAAPEMADRPNYYGTTPVMRVTSPEKLQLFVPYNVDLDRRNAVGGSLLGWSLEDKLVPLLAVLVEKAKVWDERCGKKVEQYRQSLGGSVPSDYCAVLQEVVRLADHFQVRLAREALEGNLEPAVAETLPRPRM